MSLIKSVSGVRGLVRADRPEDVTINEEVARRMGRAYASYLLRSSQPGEGLMLVGGRDGRRGGEALLSAFAAGARASGTGVVELGIVTTPGVAMMVEALGASGGVVVTASHNPAEWNGIKLMTRSGCAPTCADAAVIYGMFDRDDFEDVRASSLSLPEQIDPHDHHVEAVLRTVDVEGIRKCSFSVVLDSINGAGAVAGRLLIERLGGRLVHMNADPAATFAHRPEPVAANLQGLCERVQAEGADVGFAQDPDADRLALVDENGRFVGEEYTLVLCARRVLATRPGAAATNLSTSRMIDDVAAAAGEECVVHRSAVGEANVVEVMKSRDCVIGGEGNGGVIDPRVVYVRDSLVAMGLVLDLMAAEGKRLAELVNEFPVYAMIKDKMACGVKRIDRVTSAIRGAFGDGEVNDVDGIRVDWPLERKWLHVRGSNTEPIVRIMVEAKQVEAAESLMSKARAVIREALDLR